MDQSTEYRTLTPAFLARAPQMSPDALRRQYMAVVFSRDYALKPDDWKASFVSEYGRAFQQKLGIPDDALTSLYKIDQYIKDPQGAVPPPDIQREWNQTGKELYALGSQTLSDPVTTAKTVGTVLSEPFVNTGRRLKAIGDLPDESIPEGFNRPLLSAMALVQGGSELMNTFVIPSHLHEITEAENKAGYLGSVAKDPLGLILEYIPLGGTLAMGKVASKGTMKAASVTGKGFRKIVPPKPVTAMESTLKALKKAPAAQARTIEYLTKVSQSLDMNGVPKFLQLRLVAPEEMVKLGDIALSIENTAKSATQAVPKIHTSIQDIYTTARNRYNQLIVNLKNTTGLSPETLVQEGRIDEVNDALNDIFRAEGKTPRLKHDLAPSDAPPPLGKEEALKIAENQKMIPDKAIWNRLKSGTKASAKETARTLDELFFTAERSLEDVQRRIWEAGYGVSDNSNFLEAYKASLSTRRTKINEFQARVKNEIAGPLETFRSKFGLTRQEAMTKLGDYLHAKHVPAREWATLTEGGAGMSASKADKILREAAESGQLPILKEMADNVIKINNESLGILVEGGVITAQQADALLKKWGHTYVPLHKKEGLKMLGFNDELIELIETTSNMDKSLSERITMAKDVHGSPYYMAKGTLKESDDLVNPMMESLHQYERFVKIAERNKVLTHLGEAIEMNPDHSLWSVVDSGKKKIPYERVEGEIRYVKNGKVQQMLIKDKALYDFLTNAPTSALAAIPGITGIMKVLGGYAKVTKMAGRNVTTLAMTFAPVNMIRDAGIAFNIMKTEIGKKAALQAVRDMATLKAHRGVLANLMDRPGNEYTDAMKLLRKHGGLVEYTDNFDDLTARMESFERLMKDTGVPKDPHTVMRHISRVAEDYNKIFEQATRVAVFKQLIDSGVPLRAAALYTRGITVDFLSGGRLKSFLNGGWMFANANLQGTKRFAKALANPKFQESALTVFYTSFFMNEMNRAIAGRDPHTSVNYMDSVPDYEKSRYAHIAFPGKAPGKWALPFGLNAFWAAGRYFSDLTHAPETGMTPGKFAVSLLDAAVDSYVPVQVGSLDTMNTQKTLMSLAPTNLRYVLGMAPSINLNAFNSPVYSGSTDNAFQYRNRLGEGGEMYNAIAELFAVPKADPVLDLNPGLVRNVTKGNYMLFPGYIRDIIQGLEVGFAKWKNPDQPFETSRLPIVSRLVSPNPDRGLTAMIAKPTIEANEKVKELNELRDMAYSTNDPFLQQEFLRRYNKLERAWQTEQYITKLNDGMQPDYTEINKELRNADLNDTEYINSLQNLRLDMRKDQLRMIKEAERGGKWGFMHQTELKEIKGPPKR